MDVNFKDDWRSGRPTNNVTSHRAIRDELRLCHNRFLRNPPTGGSRGEAMVYSR